MEPHHRKWWQRKTEPSIGLRKKGRHDIRSARVRVVLKCWYCDGNLYPRASDKALKCRCGAITGMADPLGRP